MTGAPDEPDPPTSGHTARYSRANTDHFPDGRLFSRVAARNSPPLIAALAPWLGATHGVVLEIGCGTGQHGANFALAFPHLTWMMSDPDDGHRASAAAWARHFAIDTPLPRPLDAAQDWAGTLRDLGPLAAVIAINVLHIAPWDVTAGLLAGAGRVLAPGGILAIYGPFVEPGVPTGDGNRVFDANLRAKNPDWGLRDIAEIRSLGTEQGLHLTALIAMPANNRLLILRRARR